MHQGELTRESGFSVLAWGAGSSYSLLVWSMFFQDGHHDYHSSHSHSCIISSHTRLGSAQWLTLASRMEQKWSPGSFHFVFLWAPSSLVRCPTHLLEKEVMLRIMRHHTCAWRGQLGCYNPPCWGFLVIYCLCLILRLLSQELQFGGLGLVWWRNEVCPYTKCAVAQTLQIKAVDGLDSAGWTEGFRTLCAHQSLPVYVVRTHTKSRKSGQQFLLSFWEAVLWMLVSIIHRGTGGLWRQRHEEHMPLKCLVGIIRSSAWTAEAGSWSFLSHHICSEMVQRI